MPPPDPRAYPAKPKAVYFYGTCLMDAFYPEAGLAAVELMEREGVRVLYPQGQTCCGQPPYNSGYRNEALSAVRGQLPLFAQPLPIVVPSGSCAAMMHRHYRELFHGEPEREAAGNFAARVFEWSDFMVNVLRVSLRDQGPPLRVTYHPSCHLVREMGVRDAPGELLAQLEGVEVMLLPNAEECCGFGGSFSVKLDALSGAMVADKCRAVSESGADLLVSMDAGCLMNIGGAMEKAGLPAAYMPLPQFIQQRVSGGGHGA